MIISRTNEKDQFFCLKKAKRYWRFCPFYETTLNACFVHFVSNFRSFQLTDIDSISCGGGGGGWGGGDEGGIKHLRGGKVLMERHSS